MTGLDQHRERLHRLVGEIVSAIVDDPAAASEILTAVAHGISRARERADRRIEQAEHARNLALTLMSTDRLSSGAKEAIGAALIRAIGEVDAYAPQAMRDAVALLTAGKKRSAP